MILSNKQEEALRIAVARYKNREPWTCISGYAGSGKSTLVQFIVAALGLDLDKVCYVAYTGKAAQVLRSKGCPNAITAHKLLYKAKQMPNGTYKFLPKRVLEESYDLIVVDEVSMLPNDMWNLLLSHKIHVLAMGDPFQLPPVQKDDEANNHVLDNPHIFLNEIMRQAEESEIIRLSMHIRDMKPLSTFKGDQKEVLLFNPKQITPDMYLWADQILCGTNNRRIELNTEIRKNKGFGTEPEVGDKIICLKNKWDFFSNKVFDPQPLTNGTIGTISSLQVIEEQMPYWIANKPISYLYTEMDNETQDEHYSAIPIDYSMLITGEKTLTGTQEYQLKKTKTIIPPFEFAYAYAITCHKSQGSQWNKVLVVEEGWPWNTEEHARWLYTAVTRAVDRLVISTGGVR